MAKFCTKCGSGLHPDFELCPKCDAEQIAKMIKYPKFCAECGGRINQRTGSCTGCGMSYAAPVEEAPVIVPVVEAPVVAPVVEDPSVDAPVADSAVESAPVMEEPVAEPPSLETPADEPILEAAAVPAEPVAETPSFEEPVVVAPVVEEPVKTPAAEEKPVDYFADYQQDIFPYAPANQAPTQNGNQASQKVNQPQKEKATMAQKAAKQKAAKAPKAPKAAKAPKAKSSGSVFITVLMSIFLFLFSLIGSTLLSVRLMAEDQDRIDLILEDVEVSDILGLMGEDYKDSFYDTLREFIKKETGATVTARKLEKVVEESSVKRYLSGKVCDYINDFLYDEDSFDVTEREVLKLLKSNSKVIDEELGAEVSEDVLEAIADWLVNEDQIDSMRPETLKDDQPLLYYSVNIGLSWITLILIAIVILLSIITMLRNNLSQAAISGGVVLMVVGGLTSIVSVLSMWMPSLISTMLGSYLIGSVVNIFFSSSILVFGSVFLVGVLAIVAKIVVSSILAKRNQAS